MRYLCSILFVFLSANAVAAQSPTRGQGTARVQARTQTQTPSDGADAPATRVSAFRQAINEGTQAFLSGNFAGAVTAYQRGVEVEPANPEGYVHLGAAKRAAGDRTGALESYRTGKTLAQTSAPLAGWYVRALQGIAQALESDSASTQDARAHWLELTRYLEGNPALGNAEMARARIQAIDVASELEQVYAEVRARIERRERQAR